MLEINTSNYTVTKKVKIDDTNLEMRPMSTSEMVSMLALPKKIQEASSSPEEAEKIIQGFEDMFYGLFSNKDDAKKVFSKISIDHWMEIYNKIIQEA